ncbi:hypothetical protein CR205_13065 [Alteribacter lacisalsi]|uniref:Anti-bacteriophage protein A/HamA C-terminal domain-containing protein n=1 Tax=Alteribacter lacisalsi TaxID=2045244 RepID=A0A2W0HJ33_9BACI|nr:hypothetical protein CR205_13065 [Alteribacter lacisalsi]
MSKQSLFDAGLLLNLYINTEELTGFSIGYECGEFRTEAFVDLIFDSLLDFALSEREKKTISPVNASRKMRKAAQVVYSTEKYAARGEFGEVILHLLLREFFNTIPAISKFYYKDGANETVKGFDAVHIVPANDGLELWLGEVKFYNEINRAIRDVVKEIHAHTGKDYLRSEFLFIVNKIDETTPYAQQLKDLIHERASLDDIFKRIRIPVLLTYDSLTIKSHKEVCDEYTQALTDEMNKHHDSFRGKELPNINIPLILLPLEDKAKLVEALDNKLRVWQNL